MAKRQLSEHFNSHPHEEDDLSATDNDLPILNISTHILTKRMTEPDRLCFLCQIISTHILTKRMTSIATAWYHIFFISTHILTKRMTTASGMDGYAGDISTHILTKRMTLSVLNIAYLEEFQLTSPRRG